MKAEHEEQPNGVEGLVIKENIIICGIEYEYSTMREIVRFNYRLIPIISIISTDEVLIDVGFKKDI